VESWRVKPQMPAAAECRIIVPRDKKVTYPLNKGDLINRTGRGAMLRSPGLLPAALVLITARIAQPL